MNKLVCFSHGQESGPWGTKIRAMADAARGEGWAVESIDYQGMANALDRVDKLIEFLDAHGEPAVLAGSSMGGYVALAAAAQRPAAGLFLLAPALYMPGYEEHMPAPDQQPGCPTMIVHGWRDDVVPWAGSVRYASETRARLVMIDGDHRLTANIDTITELFASFLRSLATGR